MLIKYLGLVNIVVEHEDQMSLNIIETLRKAKYTDRPVILEKMYQKNLAFFRKKHPALEQFIEQTNCPFQLDITDTFLNIVHTASGRIAHPEVGLDYFAEMMGGWVHEAWTDLMNFKVAISDKHPLHFKPVHTFDTRLNEDFPEYEHRFAAGRINLKEISEKKRFSPPVVFLGIFHGLHIAHYLQHTELATALFIEPEPERFEVSCYFLDYTEIEHRFGTLHLSIGNETTSGSIESFFSLIRITPQVWVRILTGYQCDHAPYFIETIKSLQATSANLTYPLDYEMRGLLQGKKNLDQGLPLLSRPIRVSKQCRIAIVATGPSLDNDLVWLKKNRDRLIIFAVHSSVRVLRKHGIVPDFQFNLDAIIGSIGMESLQLFHEVPFITDYKIPPGLVADFETPLLCTDTYKQAVVRFVTSLTETHPSTTNLAVSFACFCRPTKIYLLGCDFGYRAMTQDHAKGSIYEEKRDRGESATSAGNLLQALVKANFSGTDPIQTIPVHLRTKIVVERCIRTNGKGISVVNVSDGAFISGARPQRSSQVQLTPYSKKEDDVRAIINGFIPAQKGENWEPYVEPGAVRLDRLKKDLINVVTLTSFSWKGFSQAIDSVLSTVLGEQEEGDKDLRMDTYYRVLVDLLTIWYRFIIFFDDTSDAEAVYTAGLEELKAILDELKWPGELDEQ